MDGGGLDLPDPSARPNLSRQAPQSVGQTPPVGSLVPKSQTSHSGRSITPARSPTGKIVVAGRKKYLTHVTLGKAVVATGGSIYWGSRVPRPLQGFLGRRRSDFGSSSGVGLTECG